MANFKKMLSGIFRAKAWNPEEMEFEPFPVDVELQVCFREETAYRLAEVPAGYQQHELAEIDGVTEKDFHRKLTLFRAFCHEVSRTFVVLSRISARGLDPNRSQGYWDWKTPQYEKLEDVPPPKPFPVFYYHQVRDVRPAESLWLDMPWSGSLWMLTWGMDENAWRAERDERNPHRSYWEIYLFREENYPASAQEASEAALAGAYDMRLLYLDTPDRIVMILNPETVDVERLRTIAERLCEKHGLMLCPN